MSFRTYGNLLCQNRSQPYVFNMCTTFEVGCCSEWSSSSKTTVDNEWTPSTRPWKMVVP